MPRPAWGESLRAAAGVGFGLLFCNLLLLLSGAGGAGLLLIAPFGASAFLVFVVPNSPLAQPWSVTMGNSLSALAALVVLQTGLSPAMAAPVAVGLAVVTMAATRSLHPPGGAVALATVMAAPGWGFVLTPVLAGSVALVLAGIGWNRATGRVYPFRLPPDDGAHRTADPAPDRRLGLAAGDVAAVLERLRMSPNIGVEDAARVIDAVGNESVAHHLRGLTAGAVMSRDLVTVLPDDPLPALAKSFRHHRFKTLPVVNAQGRYLGLLGQQDMLGQTNAALTAATLAQQVQTVGPDAGMSELMGLLQDGMQQAVPVLDQGRLAGLVTRSDLIALLAARLRGLPAD